VFQRIRLSHHIYVWTRAIRREKATPVMCEPRDKQ
jgi:hypothetical protein